MSGSRSWKSMSKKTRRIAPAGVSSLGAAAGGYAGTATLSATSWKAGIWSKFM